MAAAVPAAAVPAAAVEAATTTSVEAATAVNCATVESAADCAATSKSTTVKSTTVKATTTAVEPAPKTTSAEAAAEPRAGTDEQTTGEPARTVVTVRRAGVGVIPIVAVFTNGSRTNIPRADAHADRETLSISVRR